MKCVKLFQSELKHLAVSSKHFAKLSSCPLHLTMKVAKRHLLLPRPLGEGRGKGTIRRLALSLAGVAPKRHDR